MGSIHFAPQSGNFILSGSVDTTIKLWDISQIKNLERKGKPLVVSSAIRTVIAHEMDINCVRWAPNEKIIATAGQDKLIKVALHITLNIKLLISCGKQKT